jgi:Glycosyl hydrolases family 16
VPKGQHVLRSTLPENSPGARHGARRVRGHAAARRIPWRWRLVPVAAAVPLLVGSVAMAAGSASVNYEVTSPVTLQALGVDNATPVAGTSVTAGAKVVAASDQTFDYVVLAVRDQAGRNFDFPGTPNWTLGTTQKTYQSSRAFATAGTYTYWFAYHQGSQWTDLSPKRTFTVLPAGSTTSPTPTPSASSPAPSPSPTSTGGTGGGNPVPVGPSGTWTYKFGDEFSGPVAWGSKWADSSSAEGDNGHGNMGNQQLEWNHSANCSTSNGILTMMAKPDSITSPSGQHYNWSSCLLSSSPSYAFRYGYMEIRAQLPGPKGFWPAFWTWQAAGNNQWTETDVYEFYSDNHSRLYLTQHSGAGGGTVYGPPFDPTTGFHTYGADIEPDGTHFYVDGRLVYTAAGTSTGMTNIILDNFVYSVIPPAPGTSAAMQVDYVRAWQH